MILKVVQLAKLLPTAHFPFYDALSPITIPSPPAFRLYSSTTYFLTALDPGEGTYYRPKGL